jgi:hypothetical protein
MRTLIFTIMSTCLTAFGQTVEVYNHVGKKDDKDWTDQAKQIFICGGGLGRWITIGRIDATSPDKNGFSPNWTYIIIRAPMVPIMKKLPNGNYEITFTSEFTKNLP